MLSFQRTLPDTVLWRWGMTYYIGHKLCMQKNILGICSLHILYLVTSRTTWKYLLCKYYPWKRIVSWDFLSTFRKTVSSGHSFTSNSFFNRRDIWFWYWLCGVKIISFSCPNYCVWTSKVVGFTHNRICINYVVKNIQPDEFLKVEVVQWRRGHCKVMT